MYTIRMSACLGHRFVSLSCGVDVILGNNGYIWITLPSEDMKSKEAHRTQAVGSKGQEADKGETLVSQESRERMARVRNSILALAKMNVAIYPTTIMDVYNESLKLGLLTKNLISPDVLQRVTQTAMTRKRQQR